MSARPCSDCEHFHTHLFCVLPLNFECPNNAPMRCDSFPSRMVETLPDVYRGPENDYLIEPEPEYTFINKH